MSIWDIRFGKPKRLLTFDEALKAAGLKRPLTFIETLEMIALDEWKTIKGAHVEIGEGGEILHGMEGKYKTINDVPRKTVKQRKGESIEQTHERAREIFAKQDAEKAAAENAAVAEQGTANSRVTLTAASLPKAFTSTKADAENTEKLLDFINSCKNANPDSLELLNNAGNIINVEGGDLSITYETDQGMFRPGSRELEIPKIDADPPTGQALRNIHELAHAIDFYSADNGVEFSKKGIKFHSSSDESKELNKFIKPDRAVGEEASNLFKATEERIDAAKRECSERHEKTNEELRAAFNRKEITQTEFDKKFAEEALRYRKDYGVSVDNAAGAVSNLEDIYHALARGDVLDKNIKFGHDRSYWRNKANVINEIFAEYVTLSVAAPEYVEVLRRDKPELVAALEKQVRAMNAKAKARKAG